MDSSSYILSKHLYVLDIEASFPAITNNNNEKIQNTHVRQHSTILYLGSVHHDTK